MSFETFDRSRLCLKPLSERAHDLDLSVMKSAVFDSGYRHPAIPTLSSRIRAAREAYANVTMMLGGHVIRAGVAPSLNAMMEAGFIRHFALNGAAAIHDFEFALIGKTTESVARYISEGQFGLWKEDDLFNEAVNRGAKAGLGMGEALGKFIEDHRFPFRQYSLLAAGYRNRVPLTVHVSIGCDIVHELPGADGASIGEASYRDFLIYARRIERLEKGVFLNFGSAVTGPEVYLKALSMARNVATQEGRSITRFTTAVFDLLDLEGGDRHEEPSRSDPRYYFRPWKTILVRTVADGGESYYVRGLHQDTVPALAYALLGNDHEQNETV